MTRREAKAVEPHEGGSSVMSRRQALGRFSKGAVAAGVAAWVAPEILVATPSAAGALSAPPTSPGGGGGGPITPGSGSITGGGGSGAPFTPVVAGSGGNVAASTPKASPSTAAAHSAGTLPFTGFDAEHAAEIAGGLIAGGWALTRWASRKPNVAPADGGGSSGDQDALR